MCYIPQHVVLSCISAVQTSTDIIANLRQHQAEHAASLPVQIRHRPSKIQHQIKSLQFNSIKSIKSVRSNQIQSHQINQRETNSRRVANVLLIADHGSSAVQAEQGAILLGGSFRQNVAGRGPVPPRSPGAGPRQPPAAAV